MEYSDPNVKYIAHSENGNGEEQTIKQHSEGVADIMKSFALTDEYADIYAYCGLLHDVGKYSEGFQDISEREEKKNLMPSGALIWQRMIG